MIRRSLLALVLVLFGACGRAANSEGAISDALEQASIRDVKVDADNGGRVVHLRGTVETLADRVRAEEIAAAIVGTSGTVRNELTVSGIDDHTGEAPATTTP